MAASGKKAGASKGRAPQRRMTGQKQGQTGERTQGTATAQGTKTVVQPEKAAEAALDSALDEVVHIAGRGGFQLRADRELPDGTYVEGWSLKFGRRGFIVGDEKTVAAVEKVLAGEWTDGRVTGRDFLKNAKRCGLKIIRHGLEKPPFDTWDETGSEARVDLALRIGKLRTPAQIAEAIRYEKQSPKRQPAREADAVTVAKLEALLAAVRGGVKVEGVDGAAASAGGVLAAGAMEL